MERRFNVVCSNCSFEREVDGRDHAERLAQQHSSETSHEVLAVELPPRLASN